jgi:hypothetical protein
VRGVAQQLLARLVALELAAQRELAPQPGHRDVLGARPELAAQQRAPDRAPGPAPHARLDPLARRDRLERPDVLGPPLQQQHGEPHPQAGGRRQRPEAQEVQRPVEGPLAPLEEERHRGRLPFQLVAHPELLVERDDVAVAREEVVVVALEQLAAADVERRRLAAKAGPALVDVAGVALLRQAIGADEAGDARPEHRYAHGHARTRARMRPMPP